MIWLLIALMVWLVLGFVVAVFLGPILFSLDSYGERHVAPEPIPPQSQHEASQALCEEAGATHQARTA